MDSEDIDDFVDRLVKEANGLDPSPLPSPKAIPETIVCK